MPHNTKHINTVMSVLFRATVHIVVIAIGGLAYVGIPWLLEKNDWYTSRESKILQISPTFIRMTWCKAGWHKRLILGCAGPGGVPVEFATVRDAIMRSELDLVQSDIVPMLDRMSQRWNDVAPKTDEDFVYIEFDLIGAVNGAAVCPTTPNQGEGDWSRASCLVVGADKQYWMLNTYVLPLCGLWKPIAFVIIMSECLTFILVYIRKRRSDFKSSARD